MTSADTSVLVRYLVGTPTDHAQRAADLFDGAEAVALSVVAVVECAHVLRTQYAVPARDIVEALLGVLGKENVVLLGMPKEAAMRALLHARSLPGRPIPDALIVEASRVANAVPLVTFDREMSRYGPVIRQL